MSETLLHESLLLDVCAEFMHCVFPLLMCSSLAVATVFCLCVVVARSVAYRVACTYWSRALVLIWRSCCRQWSSIFLHSSLASKGKLYVLVNLVRSSLSFGKDSISFFSINQGITTTCNGYTSVAHGSPWCYMYCGFCLPICCAVGPLLGVSRCYLPHGLQRLSLLNAILMSWRTTPLWAGLFRLALAALCICCLVNCKHVGVCSTFHFHSHGIARIYPRVEPHALGKKRTCSSRNKRSGRDNSGYMHFWK